jgi:hypothetical protein
MAYTEYRQTRQIILIQFFILVLVLLNLLLELDFNQIGFGLKIDQMLETIKYMIQLEV